MKRVKERKNELNIEAQNILKIKKIKDERMTCEHLATHRYRVTLFLLLQDSFCCIFNYAYAAFQNDQNVRWNLGRICFETLCIMNMLLEGPGPGQKG